MRFIYDIGKVNRYESAWLHPCPYLGRHTLEARRVSHKLKKIANKMFLGNENKYGAAANNVYTAGGTVGVLFKHSDKEINLKRAKEVAKEYRRMYGSLPE